MNWAGVATALAHAASEGSTSLVCIAPDVKEIRCDVMSDSDVASVHGPGRGAHVLLDGADDVLGGGARAEQFLDPVSGGKPGPSLGEVRLGSAAGEGCYVKRAFVRLCSRPEFADPRARVSRSRSTMPLTWNLPDAWEQDLRRSMAG